MNPAAAARVLLRLWREGRGLTQDDAARLWGVTRTSWNRYENGKRAVPLPLQKWIAGRLAQIPKPK